MKSQKPDKPQKLLETPSWALALLAAILEPEAVKSQRQDVRGAAVRRARAFIDEVPGHLSPSFEQLSTEEQREKLRSDVQQRKAQRERFGLPQDVPAAGIRRVDNPDEEMNRRLLQRPDRPGLPKQSAIKKLRSAIRG
jgi:hypothetical protein